MPTETPRIMLEVNYYQAAQKYLASLPLEHFMEATPQATQRRITLESLCLVHAQRPDVQFFNELLVQYPLAKPRGKKKIGQVVPDNMVVLHDQPIQAEGSYDVPLQPVAPFWMLEYLSKSNRRKDYDDNMLKYEHDLKVPYYLLFAPDMQELTLYRHTGEKYVTVVPNGNGRCALPQLEMEVALLDGWVRFWFRSELLPLPADLLREVQAMRQQLRHAERLVEQEKQGRLAAEARADSLAKELERMRQSQPRD
jgi:hypothetical protein